MRKIPSECECPFDDLILRIIDNSGIMELFYAMGAVPNILTTLGNLLRVASLYMLFQGKKLWFFLLALGGFFFDCLDGHYARKYNMTTVFGDYYDHIGDLVYHLILLYLIFTSPGFTILPRIAKIGLTLVIGIFAYLFLMHMGCQEHFFICEILAGNCSDTLSPCKKLCSDRDKISWTKYFGTGTFVLLLYLLTILLY